MEKWGEKMKLATALSERADLQRRISELGGRLNNNAKVQDGEKPSEDPMELLTELNKVLQDLKSSLPESTIQIMRQRAAT